MIFPILYCIIYVCISYNTGPNHQSFRIFFFNFWQFGGPLDKSIVAFICYFVLPQPCFNPDVICIEREQECCNSSHHCSLIQSLFYIFKQIWSEELRFGTLIFFQPNKCQWCKQPNKSWQYSKISLEKNDCVASLRKISKFICKLKC